jgi:trk system potassium uptake protein TrkA
MGRFAVIGLGLLGRTVARELTDRGGEVIAVDQDPGLVQLVADSVALAVRLDSTNREAMKAQGIDKVDAALVAIGENFEAAVLTTALLKELGVKRVISRAVTEDGKRILKLLNPDEVVLVEEMMGKRLAQQLLMPSIMEVVELAKGMSVARIEAPAEVWGKTLKSLTFRQRYGLNVVAVLKRESPDAETGSAELLDPDETISKGDVLVVDGPEAAIKRLAALDTETE